MRERSAPNGGFTLVEALAALAVFTLLIALIAPALGQARALTERVTCASNLRQCGTGLWSYAQSRRGVLPANPAPGYESTLFRLKRGADWDLRDAIDPHLGDFSAWRCPSLPGAAPLNAEGNTRFACYGTYNFYPGRTAPEFNDNEPVPRRYDRAKQPAQAIMMQDVYQDGLYRGLIRYNHGRGKVVAPLSRNPSMRFKRGPGGPIPSQSAGAGINLLMFDGHVDWRNAAELTDVGRVLIGASYRAYSARR